MDPILPEIRAARLVVPDAAGNPRIVLDLNDQGDPAIRLLDADGNVRIRLGLEHDVDSEPEYCGLIAELRLSGGDGGGEATLAASYANYAAIEIGAVSHGSEDEAAGAWIEAKEGRRLEAMLHDRPGGDGWSFSAGNSRARQSSIDGHAEGSA